MDSLAALATATVAGRIVYFHHQMAEPPSVRRRPPSCAPTGRRRRRARGAIGDAGPLGGHRVAPHAAHRGGGLQGSQGRAFPRSAIATEDAAALHRWLATGPVRVRLVLGCRTDPDVESANVIAEVKGREKPGEVVLLGAHLDSWDLAVGAQDDGAGVAMVLDAARLIARLKPAPRRTVRFVLFMNEENGGAGAKAYAAAHAKETHVAALEADSGSGRPQRIEVHAGDGAVEFLAPLVRPLGVLGDRRPGGDGGAARRGPRGAGPGAGARDGRVCARTPAATSTSTTARPTPWTRSTLPPSPRPAAAHAWLTWALADAAGVLNAPPIEPRASRERSPSRC